MGRGIKSIRPRRSCLVQRLIDFRYDLGSRSLDVNSYFVEDGVMMCPMRRPAPVRKPALTPAEALPAAHERAAAKKVVQLLDALAAVDAPLQDREGLVARLRAVDGQDSLARATLAAEGALSTLGVGLPAGECSAHGPICI